MVRTGSLRTQSARHRVDHGTICGRNCAIRDTINHYGLCSSHLCQFKFVAPASRKNSAVGLVGDGKFTEPVESEAMSGLR